ncbi:MAG: flagellar hook-associated protein FlgL [Deltaproteobacteria bacterium]|nr:flagellar hook-associated protein FlgL [Deltaproteobacteria bacterium]MCL4872488.1 flagellar hook-associated protein FlgL [bacterium]
MRVTQKLSYDRYVSDLLLRQEKLYNINKQISSGRKVNAPSDDPVNAHKILTSKSLISQFGQYERNIGYALSHLGIAEQALDSAKDAVIRLQELAVTAASGTATSETRDMIKTEVDNLFDELVSIGNTRFDNRYIFAGYRSDAPAFDPSGAFQGDANVQAIKIGSSASVDMALNGGEVFGGSGGGTDIMATVAAFSAALAADDGDGVRAAIDGLEAGFAQLSKGVSDIGGRVSRLNAAEQNLSVYKLELQSTVSVLEDADMAELITDLKAGEVALQAALASAGRVFSLSIFDYLR